MTAWLRVLGTIVFAVGLGIAAWAAVRLAGDTGFAEIADRYARHQDHPLFQAEFYAAAVARRHGCPPPARCPCTAAGASPMRNPWAPRALGLAPSSAVRTWCCGRATGGASPRPRRPR